MNYSKRLSILQELWSKRFHSGDDDYLKISKPIAYFPDYNLMLASKAGGIELGKMLMEGDASMLENYIMQALSWLAKLHSIDVKSGRAFSIETGRGKAETLVRAPMLSLSRFC